MNDNTKTRSANAVLVTIANEDYLDRAKQLFVSAQRNGGWQGDYLLLAYQVPDGKLGWFRDRGIIIHHCKQINETGVSTHSKFFLFTTYFKQWRVVVYLDADIIVRASLRELVFTEGFSAVVEGPLGKQFRTPWSQDPRLRTIRNTLRDRYDFRRPSFNAGVLVFSTDIVSKNMFRDVVSLFRTYEQITNNHDQAILNLLFYDSWRPLPPEYNVYVGTTLRYYNIKPSDLDGIVLHFIGPIYSKPWEKHDPFHAEWAANLAQAEQFHAKKRFTPTDIWTLERHRTYHKHINTRASLLLVDLRINVDRELGLVGIYLRRKRQAMLRLFQDPAPLHRT